MKKYYVAAKHIGSAVGAGKDALCTYDTVEEAIASAKRTIMSEQLEAMVVVKMVKIVRRAPPPFVVVDVEDD